MNKIRVIDILNKIANGEEVPEKFRFAGQIFEKQGSYIEDENGDSIFESIFTDFSNINDEVEILEEDKKIEKLDLFTLYEKDMEKKEILQTNFRDIKDKINEIIDKLNEEN